MIFKRVSVLTLAYFIARSIMMIVRQGSNLLPLIIVFFAGGEDLRTMALVIVPIALPALIVLHALGSWWFFRYHIADNTLHIRDGIFKRKQLTLDYERIQQADVRQPWYFRPFGLSILGVESAGSEGKEVELAGLSYAYANELKNAMLAESHVTPTARDEEEERPAADLRMQLPLSEVARYGLIYNPILLLIPVLLYPLSQLNILEDWAAPRVQAMADSLNSNALAAYGWYILAALVIAALIIAMLASVAIAVVRFYNFTLTVNSQRYQSRAGLFTIVTRGFQYVRLQRVIWHQGIIARLLSRHGLRVNQSGSPNQQQGQKAFFVPVLNKERMTALWQCLQLSEPEWQRMHAMSMLLPWLLSTLVITATVAVMTGLDWVWILNALWASAVISALVQFLSWRRRAVFLDADWLAIRRGMIGEQQRWVPAYKMQTLKLRQGPWLRLWGACSLQIYSAAGRESITWLPLDQLQQWQQQLLNTTKNHTGRWM